MLVDKSDFPRVKLCGGLFTHKGQRVLEEILGPAAYQDCMLKAVSSREPHLSIWRGMARLIQLEPHRPTVLIDRPTLDEYLVRHYQALGGQLLLHDGLKAVDFAARIATLASGEQVKYNHLVAADGANSTVERLLHEADPSFKKKQRKVLALEINAEKEDLAVDGVNIYFDIVPKTYAWAFSKGPKTCLGLCVVPDTVEDPNQIFRTFLHDLGLRNEDRYPLRGALIPYGQVMPVWCKGSVLFVGDAAGLVEPLTWEGIYYALHSGQMAATSIIEGRDYAKQVKKLQTTIRHGYFCQQLFEYPRFLQIFYSHASRHKAFMERFYSENIDDSPRQPLWQKVLMLFWKTMKARIRD